MVAVTSPIQEWVAPNNVTETSLMVSSALMTMALVMPAGSLSGMLNPAPELSVISAIEAEAIIKPTAIALVTVKYRFILSPQKFDCNVLLFPDVESNMAPAIYLLYIKHNENKVPKYAKKRVGQVLLVVIWAFWEKKDGYGGGVVFSLFWGAAWRGWFLANLL